MKTIDTLVKDIHDLFNNGHVIHVDYLGAAADEFADVLMRRMSDYLRPSASSGLRMSNIGKPLRQLWYDNHEPDSEGLSADTKIKFLFGDILEVLLLYLAREAGHTVERCQEEVELNGVIGHIDAIIDGVLVDCKSASSPSFKRFANGSIRTDDPFGYIEQLSGYSMALGGLDAGFLVIDKQLGHICWCPFSAEELASVQPAAIIDKARTALSSPNPPSRCYQPKEDGVSGNLILDTGCSYCAHKKKCWADSNDGIGLRTFLYANGPRHFVNVAKEPRGPLEITF